MERRSVYIDLIHIKKEIREIGIRANDDQLKRDLYRVIEEMNIASSNYLTDEKDKKTQISNIRLAEVKNLLERVIELVDDLIRDYGDESPENVDIFEQCILKTCDAAICLNDIS